jgi:DNA-binding SARP family transcriptional activator
MGQLTFRLLGRLEVTDGDSIMIPSASKLRQTLALLQVRANQLVHVDTLIQELWGQDIPRSAGGTVKTYVYQLRKALRAELGVERPEDVLATLPPGYMLCAEPDQLDSFSFERQVNEARNLLHARQLEEAVCRLRSALDLWRGPMLSNVSAGTILQGSVTYFEEMRSAALEMRILAEMELGFHRHLISELSSLAKEFPLNEWVHGCLVRALGRSGRRGDALKAYARAREILQEELGLEPSSDLREAQLEILTGSRVSAMRHLFQNQLIDQTPLGRPVPDDRAGAGWLSDPRGS